MAASGTETDGGEEAPAPAWRTVTDRYRSRPDAEMTAIGYIYFLVLVVVLIPLVPFLVVIWVLGRLIEVRREQAPADE